ncbi:hypothetical protein [Aquimarina sp. AU474]|uniref:hypothetical protein n=1 Tax=Aquimarina sp. AU474 TaxID=2108529 RepID=UPI001F17A642|nr:hypothetical protein [Aquimarina sp. AU474]
MKKIVNNRLSIEKLVVARISDLKSIRGGADQISWIYCESDLTTKGKEIFDVNN